MESEYRPYRLEKKIVETPSTSTLCLLPQSGARPDFIAGQFVNVSLPEHGPEAKSYSISSSPREPHLALSVRAAGNFSRALLSKKVGDELLLSDPLGYFYPEDDSPRVFVAGGIGVTPCMSIIRSAHETGAMPRTLLLYSSRSADEVVFRGALDAVASLQPQQRTDYFLTREAGEPHGMRSGRISAQHLAQARRQWPDARFYLCGSIAFVRDMRRALKELAVPEEAIYTESFF